MTVTVSTDNPRSVKALALLPTARTWTHGTRKSDGRAFLVAPASKLGAVYFVDANGAECTCPDRQTRRVDCKHMLAARLLPDSAMALGTYVCSIAVTRFQVGGLLADLTPFPEALQPRREASLAQTSADLCGGLLSGSV